MALPVGARATVPMAGGSMRLAPGGTVYGGSMRIPPGGGSSATVRPAGAGSAPIVYGHTLSQQPQATSQVCPHCGAPYMDDASFCRKCGNKREQMPVVGQTSLASHVPARRMPIGVTQSLPASSGPVVMKQVSMPASPAPVTRVSSASSSVPVVTYNSGSRVYPAPSHSSSSSPRSPAVLQPVLMSHQLRPHHQLVPHPVVHTRVIPASYVSQPLTPVARTVVVDRPAPTTYHPVRMPSPEPSRRIASVVVESKETFRPPASPETRSRIEMLATPRHRQKKTHSSQQKACRTQDDLSGTFLNNAVDTFFASSLRRNDHDLNIKQKKQLKAPPASHQEHVVFGANNGTERRQVPEEDEDDHAYPDMAKHIYQLGHQDRMTTR